MLREEEGVASTDSFHTLPVKDRLKPITIISCEVELSGLGGPEVVKDVSVGLSCTILEVPKYIQVIAVVVKTSFTCRIRVRSCTVDGTSKITKRTGGVVEEEEDVTTCMTGLKESVTILHTQQRESVQTDTRTHNLLSSFVKHSPSPPHTRCHRGVTKSHGSRLEHVSYLWIESWVVTSRLPKVGTVSRRLCVLSQPPVGEFTWEEKWQPLGIHDVLKEEDGTLRTRE